jgi:SAM-dependent methyltransferase
MKAEFDKLATGYDNWHGNLIKGSGFGREYFLEYKVKEVAKVLAKKNFVPKNILDFGCGVGDVTPYLQKYFPAANIFGVDISAESVETAKKTHALPFAALGENWIQENALAQFETPFDLVFVAGVFHHAPPQEHAQILQSIKANMAQNAKIFIFELNPYNPATRHVFAKYEKPVDRNANLLPPRHLKKILRGLDFCVSRKMYTIFFPHALRFFLPLEKYLSWLPLGAHYYIFGE